MGRAIFDNSVGLYGVRGKIFDEITIITDNQTIKLRGVYLRIDRHGNPSVICKLPNRDYSVVTQPQQNNRDKFKRISQQVSFILNNPIEREIWQQRFDEYKENANITYIWRKSKIITLKGFIFSTLYNS